MLVFPFSHLHQQSIVLRGIYRQSLYCIPTVERPNLGCRMLMYHNFSKILSGINNDISDWVVATRIKSGENYTLKSILTKLDILAKTNT